jgi:hypothetical protein
VQPSIKVRIVSIDFCAVQESRPGRSMHAPWAEANRPRPPGDIEERVCETNRFEVEQPVSVVPSVSTLTGEKSPWARTAGRPENSTGICSTTARASGTSAVHSAACAVRRDASAQRSSGSIPPVGSLRKAASCSPIARARAGKRGRRDRARRPARRLACRTRPKAGRRRGRRRARAGSRSQPRRLHRGVPASRGRGSRHPRAGGNAARRHARRSRASRCPSCSGPPLSTFRARDRTTQQMLDLLPHYAGDRSGSLPSQPTLASWTIAKKSRSG